MLSQTPNIQNQNKQILSLTELATMLGKKPKTLYNWKNKGVPLPPSYRIPGVRGERYLLDDVINWIRGFRVPTEQTKRRGRPRKAVQ